MEELQVPQLEDGFTRIANELLEAILSFGFTQRQLLVLLTVVRKTYGYGKKEDDMSASQIAQLCNMHRPHVSTVLGELERMNVINKSSGRFGMIIGINKLYGEWIGFEKAPKAVSKAVAEAPASTDSVQGESDAQTSTDSVQGVPNQYSGCTDSVQVASTESVHTKENLPKETQKKGRARRQDVSLADWLAACRDAGLKAIPEDDPIYDYLDKQGMSVEMLRLCWLEFRRKYSDPSKKQKDWRAHFRNAVRENWYGLWFEKDGVFLLTTRGKQVEREHREAHREAA